MRKFALLVLPLFAFLAIPTPAHTGSPPPLPSTVVNAVATIPASTASTNVVGTSWCLYSCGHSLTCKKNGASVTLTFNSITTNTPHTYHTDTTWDVNLTPLGLVSGDVLIWSYYAWATSGPNLNQRVLVTAVTVVH